MQTIVRPHSHPLSSPTQEPIAVDLRINVVLVGLNGDGAFTYKLPESRLASLLATALPTYRPSLVEEERPLNVEYTLRYDVHHQHNIGTFTKMLGEELSKLGPVRCDTHHTPHTRLPRVFLITSIAAHDPAGQRRDGDRLRGSPERTASVAALL